LTRRESNGKLGEKGILEREVLPADMLTQEKRKEIGQILLSPLFPI